MKWTRDEEAAVCRIKGGVGLWGRLGRHPKVKRIWDAVVYEIRMALTAERAAPRQGPAITPDDAASCMIHVWQCPGKTATGNVFRCHPDAEPGGFDVGLGMMLVNVGRPFATEEEALAFARMLRRWIGIAVRYDREGLWGKHTGPPLDLGEDDAETETAPPAPPVAPVQGQPSDMLTPHQQRLADEGHCMSDGDGDCTWSGCPQLRDGEPKATGRHCPRDIATRKRLDPEDEGKAGE